MSKLQLTDLDPRKLPEFLGWEEQQKEVVRTNPFIEITDNKSYEEAKKHRTALVSARTTIQKQDKLVTKKINDFKNSCKTVSQELIEITLPHENKQQEEVKRYEQIKEQKRLEKERLEKERKNKIIAKIEGFYNNWYNEFEKLTIDQVHRVEQDFICSAEKFQAEEYEEFELDFIEKLRTLQKILGDKIKVVKEKEQMRIEQEKIAEENKKLEAAREAQRLAEEKAEIKRKAEQAKIDKERKELEQEKQRIEAEKAAKIEEEKAKEIEAQKEKSRIEEEKRQKALLPDKEKIKDYINSLKFEKDQPNVKDRNLNHFTSEIPKKKGSFIEALLKDLETIK